MYASAALGKNNRGNRRPTPHLSTTNHVALLTTQTRFDYLIFRKGRLRKDQNETMKGFKEVSYKPKTKNAISFAVHSTTKQHK